MSFEQIAKSSAPCGPAVNAPRVAGEEGTVSHAGGVAALSVPFMQLGRSDGLTRSGGFHDPRFWALSLRRGKENPGDKPVVGIIYGDFSM
jgi:hypothetical protein